ncbi:MAG TPA: ATP-binding protein [Bacteroidales bacterium]|nr:ATP-binding protein [Bacteroidales bacterium]HRZ50355.1 ATP-binding protein [Bacteroidales bacterium]
MFVNREKEIFRIHSALARERSQLIALYGRRRCGKSTLLQQALPPETIYFSADLQEKPLQIAALAMQAGRVVPGFATAVYPDWQSLFVSLNNVLKKHTVLCIDEFPYLVKNSPELPSVLQNFVDQRHQMQFHLILCGSSQQMMHSMVFDKTSPLYGRCDEIIHIRPMGWREMKTFLGLTPCEAIREFGVWGGVPRYWEIRQSWGSFEDAVRRSILDQNGILYEEPERLFADELRTSLQAYSILSLIGVGAHRPSEIAARLGKPATQLARPLAFLVHQGYVRREIPFGESPRSSKRSLYKIDDPFLNFYFSFLVPHKSRLEFDMTDEVWEDVSGSFDPYISTIWEHLSRLSVASMVIDGHRFNLASRWWGTGLDRKPMELDIVALSADGTALLVGEAKWSDKDRSREVAGSLTRKAANLPFPVPEKICKVLFQQKKANTPGITVVTPEQLFI